MHGPLYVRSSRSPTSSTSCWRCRQENESELAQKIRSETVVREDGGGKDQRSVYGEISNADELSRTRELDQQGSDGW